MNAAKTKWGSKYHYTIIILCNSINCDRSWPAIRLLRTESLHYSNLNFLHVSKVKNKFGMPISLPTLKILGTLLGRNKNIIWNNSTSALSPPRMIPGHSAKEFWNSSPWYIISHTHCCKRLLSSKCRYMCNSMYIQKNKNKNRNNYPTPRKRWKLAFSFSHLRKWSLFLFSWCPDLFELKQNY